MRNLDEVIASLPPAQRAKVLARGHQLIAEEMILRHLRKARKLTQENMAKLLGVRQDSISKLENRSDMLISTLRSYVEAMGGSLRLVAEFRDQSVVISKLGDLGNDDDAHPSPPPPATHTKTCGNSRPELAIT